jgi:hypothetical protein
MSCHFLYFQYHSFYLNHEFFLTAPLGIIMLLTNFYGKAVECGGASTTSAGAWHLGLLRGWDEGDAASAWLSRVLNADVIKTNAQKKEASAPPAKVAEFRLVRAAGVRALATYAGPTQVPFSEDVSQQRLGAASPFKMQHVPVQAHGVLWKR